MENKVLGKGLSALIPKKENNVHSEQKLEQLSTDSSGIVHSAQQSLNKVNNSPNVKTSLIKDNTLQPRENYDDVKLADLMASIKEKGVLQPILVRPSGNGYEVVAGERRLRAARALGLEEVPVIVKTITDKEALVLALVENIQREDLNPMEEARGYKRLIEEFNYTQESVAQSIGKDRATIANLMRLLRLPDAVGQMVFEGKLSAGHARALLTLATSKEQTDLANEIIAKGLSVRQVENIVKQKTEPATTTIKKEKQKNRDIQILEEDLQRILGTKVKVDDKGNKGTVVIEYYSLDDLDRILNILRK